MLTGFSLSIITIYADNIITFDNTTNIKLAYKEAASSMANKAEIIMHPVRMKISQLLMRNKKKGLTPLEMLKIIKDVPQATLYRHIQILLDSGIIHVIHEKKVRAVTEKYYAINEEAARYNTEEWRTLAKEEKLSYISSYQLALYTQYQDYLAKLEEQHDINDGATFSLVEFQLNDEAFANFQRELNELMIKYYNINNNKDDCDSTIATQTVAITIIPEH